MAWFGALELFKVGYDKTFLSFSHEVLLTS